MPDSPELPATHPAYYSTPFAYRCMPGIDTWGEAVVQFSKWRGRRFREVLKDDKWCQWVLWKGTSEGFSQQNARLLVRYLKRCFALTEEQLRESFSTDELRRGLHTGLQIGDVVRSRRRISFATGEQWPQGDAGEVTGLPDRSGNVEVTCEAGVFDADVNDVEPEGVPPAGSEIVRLAACASKHLQQRAADAALRRRVRCVVEEGRCNNEQGEVSLKLVRGQLERDFGCCLKRRRTAIRQWVEECDDGTRETTPQNAVRDGEPPDPKRPRKPAVFGQGVGARPGQSGSGVSAASYYHDSVTFGGVGGGLGWETATATTI
eukprot:TRINITY_DN6587_c0_g1_i1.p1 TRINITY_DN6587_c0_g1~~TRINITY_DN6587_c0_g1_i1.p1  ORF type:complete len:335 (+),score=93.06 TRINITY_DN6587_c0_g1_i1:49-1005(+)